MKKHIIILFASFCILAISCGGGSDSPGLDFIFQDSSEIAEIRCYHLHPWSPEGEIHSGLDISPKYADLIGTSTVRKTPIVAPCSGVIEKFIKHASGAGAKMYSFVIKMNDYWRVLMSFEPQTADTAIIAEQETNFLVSEGDEVTKGQLIGNLVYGKLLEDHYPHIHFSILYIKPGDTIDSLAADILNVPRNNGTPTPPPREGASSPWEAENLGTASQFFCPYLYFTDAAQTVLDSVPTYSVNSELCTCSCAYNSANGDCGVCAP